MAFHRSCLEGSKPHETACDDCAEAYEQQRAEFNAEELWQLETGAPTRFFVEDLEPQKEDR